jgi:hypothetical protein
MSKEKNVQTAEVGEEVKGEALPQEFKEVIIAPVSNPSLLLQEITLTPEVAKSNLEVAKKLTSYIGADAEQMDSYVNTVLTLTGAICHPCTVRTDDDILVDETRTVFKAKTTEGKAVTISMVSKSAGSFCENILFPYFGKGDFPIEVPVKVTQQGGNGKRTYGFQIV